MASSNLLSISEAIERILGADGIVQVEAVIAEIAGQFGFCSFQLLEMPAQVENAFPSLLINTTSPSWIQIYRAENCYVHDHLVRHARQVDRPFTSLEAPFAPSEARRVRKLFEAMKNCGTPFSLAIPLARNQGRTKGAFLFGDNHKTSNDVRRSLELLFRIVAVRFSDFSTPANVRDVGSFLTVREREVLQWAAQGKTSWETGHIMGVTEGGVNKLIASAMKRFETVSKVHAVAMALRFGEIDP